jgi:hypothetical protein
MTDDSPFQSLHLAQVQRDIRDLYQRIAAEKGRIEIRDGNGTSECVLISKAELQTLEEALAILSDRDDVRELAHRVECLAQAAEPMHA